ncbi:Exostosin-1b [Taenia crassiceps]|uniref:Exostosin-1b n=1 Tax=Taenia crassiceps TaxID=6207 RepID=A0ABR4QKY1_9CEST
MHRRASTDYSRSPYDSINYHSNSPVDYNYSFWLHGDGEYTESRSLNADIPPYQMNCGHTEASAIEALSNIYYDSQSSLPRDNAPISTAMSEPSDTMCCGSASSTDDFDFDQSYRRLVQNANSLRECADIQSYQYTSPKPPTNQRQKINTLSGARVQYSVHGTNLRKASDRDFEMERELRRLRNNEASRRSRREKKRRFLEIERRVEEMKASNKRLSEFVLELDSIIEEAKAMLLAVTTFPHGRALLDMERCATLLSRGFRAKMKTVCVIFAVCAFILLYFTVHFFSYVHSDISRLVRNEASTISDAKFKSHCTMNTCFDSSRCSKFKVYVYPDDPRASEVSANYKKILDAIRRSPFYTANPREACLFVPSLDTLDRDPRSLQYIPDLHKRLSRLPYWSFQPGSSQSMEGKRSRPGMNHLLFILFPGSWPNYDVDELRMDVGNAMLARASASKVRMRKGFDISFPLVTSNYPEAGQPPRYTFTEDARIRLTLLTSFKNWNLYADARCAADNVYYETVSYEELLHNSTFCLVPRGRRLGSFRFLEVLEAGCIPVLLANDWELPFSEVIDWSQAAVIADERTLSRLPDLLRNLQDSQIVKMREQVRFIWNSYFCSVDAIIHATLMSIRDRLTLRQKNYDLWNRRPGGILFSEPTTINGCEYPLPGLPVKCQDDINKGFTLVITIRQPFCKDFMERSGKLASVFVRSRHLKKVIIVWQCSNQLPPSSEKLSVEVFNGLPVALSFAPLSKAPSPTASSTPSPSNRFLPAHKDIPTIAVWSAELDIVDSLDLHQIDSAYALWLQYPHRLVGFTARAHVWDSKIGAWNYSLNASFHGNFSMVLLNAAVYHRYYHTLYWRLTTPKMRETTDTLATGEDILFNCVVGYATQSAPLLLTFGGAHSPVSAEASSELVNYMGGSTPDLNQRSQVAPSVVLAYRHTCLRAFANHFIPLYNTASANPQTGRHFGLMNSTNVSFLPLYYSNLRFVSTGRHF